MHEVHPLHEIQLQIAGMPLDCGSARDVADTPANQVMESPRVYRLTVAKWLRCARLWRSPPPGGGEKEHGLYLRCIQSFVPVFP